MFISFKGIYLYRYRYQERESESRELFHLVTYAHMPATVGAAPS